jgi:predicted ATP-grasp superfamily ATP-dependent carboligase
VASAIPGLAGIFGIDLIFAKGGPCIVEVNPRLTTSYVGLRRALNVNPAVLVLETGAIKTLPVAAEAISVMLAPLGQL